MAARKPAKRTVKKPASRSASRAARRATAAPVDAPVARKAYLASLGVAERVQGEALKVYNTIAREAEKLAALTTEAAQTLAKQAGIYVQEGQKLQAEALAAAEAKARDTAREVKLFAKKTEKQLKQNLSNKVDATLAGAKDGVTRLEQVFESRVARTLNTFGVPSAQNVRELQARMADLQKALNQLNKRGVRI